MRALLRRVLHASVSVEGAVVGEIGPGALVYLGVARNDLEEDTKWMIKKLLSIRIFEDGEGKMNLPISSKESLLLVSQFTLFGNVKKGNRPSFNEAATGYAAEEIFQSFHAALRQSFAGNVQSGVFGVDMKILAEDDGPVTIWLDSHNKSY